MKTQCIIAQIAPTETETPAGAVCAMMHCVFTVFIYQHVYTLGAVSLLRAPGAP